MSLLANSNAIESGGYPIQRSLRFRSSASAYLSRTYSSAPSVRTKQTLSFWIKRGSLGSLQFIFDTYDGVSSYSTYVGFTSSDTLTFQFGGAAANNLTTTQVFRDPSAWYAITVVMDTTQATAANRVLIYVNGSQVTAFSAANYPAQNATSQWTYNTANNRLMSQWNTTNFCDGYLAEVNFIDGQALTPSSFGETSTETGVWVPKKYTGTYGTNGFYLPFTDNTSATTLAYDKSGNGNNWTANNISTTAGATYDSMTDVPTLTSATAANYCVLNPLQTTQSATAPTNGNLTSPANSGVWRRIGATMQIPSSGKFYFEYTCDSFASFPTFNIGVFSGSLDTTNNAIGYSATEWGYNAQSGYATNNNTNITSGFTTATTGDVLQLAYDASTGSIWFGKNNSWQGASSPNPATGTSPTYTGVYNIIPVMVQNWAAQSANFGQRPFSYTPPTGFKALNTFNLPDPTIKKPNQYMDATTYTGTGSALSVTNAAGFQPDFVWVKGRSGATDHALYDVVRGVQNQLESNTTTAETTETTGLTAFNSNGFSVGALAQMNTNAATYVGWQWKESATAGFDIVTYTGNGTSQNISHSLGVVPAMIITKARTGAATDWGVYHKANTVYGNSSFLRLNTTNASINSSTAWNNTAPTSTVFTVGSLADTNQSSSSMVAYLFAEIAGFSKFGSYTGNGSSDGPFVYCGFRPKYVLIKNATTAATNWFVYDSIRDTYNITGNYLRPNLSDAEATFGALDLLSNGFKIRDASANNTSGATLIFAAFSESPFKTSLAR